MLSIHDLVTAKEISAYYNTAPSDKAPYLGSVLFPSKKKLGLQLSWFKGSKGLPVVLKPSALDAKATPRDRKGVTKTETEMPFFKESMLIKEGDRQELNIVMDSGKQDYIDTILKQIFDDQTTLINGAHAQLERMRMQLLCSGRILISANGVILDYDYKMDSAHKGDATTPWSDLSSATPIADIQKWIGIVRKDTGARPTRAICTYQTWNYLLANKSIKMDLNATSGDSIILTDSMLDQYLLGKLGLKIQVYDEKYKDENGVEQSYYPDDTLTLLPGGTLGNTWFGTTPEESDLMSGGVANVSIVDTGIAITTTKTADPVNVETKASMIALPSFERIDEIFIADVD